MPLLSPGASNKEQPRLIRDKRYGHLESAAARQQNDLTPKNRYRGDSINGRYSADPVKYVKEKQGELASQLIFHNFYKGEQLL